MNSKINYIIINFILIFTLLVNIGFSQNTNQVLFDSAASAYLNQNYQKAIDLYEEILNKNENYVSSELYYNLGNCYYKDNKIGKAILYYEKAKKLSPTDEEINYNLSICNSLLSQNISAIPYIEVSKRFKDFLSSLNTNTWFWLSFGLAVISGILFNLYYLSSSSALKKTAFIIFLLFLLITFASIVLNYFNYSYFEKNKIGIIIKDEIEVRSGPSQNDNKIIIIHSGVKILILDQVKNWYEVKLPNGEVGWVESNCFEII